MAGILVRTCTVCGKVDKIPHNRDDKPAIWNINHELRNTGDPILCNNCQIRGEAIRRIDEEKKQKEARERKQRENEHKLSHCHSCNNKSTLYHYIFDKRTKKVQESWSNATDPQNQLVFCNKVCFDNYLDKEYSFGCEQCYSKIKFDQTYYPLKGNKNIKFCSQDCGVKYLIAKEQKRQEVFARESSRLQEKINQLNNQRFNLLYETMTKSEDISIYDWENADWLDSNQKEICRKYTKERQELEELKGQKNAMTNDNATKFDSDDLASSISSSQTNHNYKNNNSTHINQQSNQNSSNNPNNNSSSQQNNNNSKKSSNTSSNKPSIKLNIDPSAYRFSDSNSEQDTNFRKKFNEILQEINGARSSLILFSTNISEQQKIFLDSWQKANILGKVIDIGKLKLPKDKKNELYELFSVSQVKEFSMTGSNDMIFPIIIFISSIIFLITIPTILIIRWRRKKKLKQKLSESKLLK